MFASILSATFSASAFLSDTPLTASLNPVDTMSPSAFDPLFISDARMAAVTSPPDSAAVAEPISRSVATARCASVILVPSGSNWLRMSVTMPEAWIAEPIIAVVMLPPVSWVDTACDITCCADGGSLVNPGTCPSAAGTAALTPPVINACTGSRPITTAAADAPAPEPTIRPAICEAVCIPASCRASIVACCEPAVTPYCAAPAALDT